MILFIGTYGITAADVPINNIMEGKNHCGAGCSIVSIGADGSLYPCHMLMEKQFKIGNLIEKNMSELFKVNKLKEMAWESKVDQIDDCKNCEYKYLCGGGCRARAYLMKGDIKASDSFCRMYKEFYKTMFSNLIGKLERGNHG